MTHNEKVQYLIIALRKRGIPAKTTAPPLHRLLWRFGFNVRPPHFQSFLSLALLSGAFFGVLYTSLMYLILWRSKGMPFVRLCEIAPVAGALFGIPTAGYYHWSAKKLKLVSWDEYPNQDPLRRIAPISRRRVLLVGIIYIILLARVVVWRRRSRSTAIVLKNQSSKVLTDVIVSGSGFSQRIESLVSGAQRKLEVNPRGESSVRLTFEAGGRQIDSGGLSYFEGGGNYQVLVTVDSDLKVSASVKIRQY